MGDPPADPPTPPPPPPPPATTLIQPTSKKRTKPRLFRLFRNVFRSFPIITPAACKFPTVAGGRIPTSRFIANAADRVTGTLFGHRKGRVSLSIQETSRTLPTVVVELAMQTQVLQKEMGLGMVRIALECERRPPEPPSAASPAAELIEEPLWTMYCNGKKIGYAVKRDANEEDLNVMEVLKAVSMGAGVLPGRSATEGLDGEVAYVRACFDRVVGSKDSETFYMVSPDGNNGPELSIFFVRV